MKEANFWNCPHNFNSQTRLLPTLSLSLSLVYFVVQLTRPPTEWRIMTHHDNDYSVIRENAKPVSHKLFPVSRWDTPTRIAYNTCFQTIVRNPTCHMIVFVPYIKPILNCLLQQALFTPVSPSKAHFDRWGSKYVWPLRTISLIQLSMMFLVMYATKMMTTLLFIVNVLPAAIFTTMSNCQSTCHSWSLVQLTDIPHCNNTLL